MTPLEGLGIEDVDGIVVARMVGEIDLANARDARDDLIAAIPNSALGLVVDLTAVSYLDSSGVHLLFELAERLGRRQQQVRIAVPEGAPVRRVLRIVEIDAVIPVLAGVDAAVADIRGTS